MKKLLGILGLAALVSFGCSKTIEGKVVNEHFGSNDTFYEILEDDNDIKYATPKNNSDPLDVGDCVRVNVFQNCNVRYLSLLLIRVPPIICEPYLKKKEVNGIRYFSRVIWVPKIKEVKLVDCEEAF